MHARKDYYINYIRMKIEDKLTESILTGIKTLYNQEVPAKMVQLQKTKKEFEGHLTLVVFPFLKMSKKGPEQTAQEIGEYLKQHEPAIASYNVIKGFLNLTIASNVWIDLLNRIQADSQWGIQKAADNAPLVMIEYSSPNTNKPLHLGHVRNNLLGNALANIMAANGNKVVKTNIVNDRGIHICKSMLACSMNWLTTTGCFLDTLAASCRKRSSSSWLEHTFMAAPESTYDGRTSTGKPTF